MADLVLEIAEGKGTGRQTTLTGSVEIGSAADAGLSVDDPHVAARHARISLAGEGAEIEDLGTLSGTYVNEHPIHGQHPIRPGDQLRVGTTVLELRTAEQAAASSRAVSTPPVRDVSADVMAPVASEHLPPATEHAPNVASFLAEETEVGFVPSRSPGEPPEQRYGALSSWTDTRVKHQTHVAAFGLLGVTAIAVLLFFA